jgi:hypothetical protein
MIDTIQSLHVREARAELVDPNPPLPYLLLDGCSCGFAPVNEHMGLVPAPDVNGKAFPQKV